MNTAQAMEAVPPYPSHLGKLTFIDESWPAIKKETALKKDVDMLVKSFHPDKNNAIGQFYYMLKSVELMEVRNNIVKENMDALEKEMKKEFKKVEVNMKTMEGNMKKINDKLDKILSKLG